MPTRSRAQVTERTFYPPILNVIQEKGGSGVSEVAYGSVPDVEFDFLGEKWLLSVKVGESPAIIKSALLQYLRHKEESGIKNGILLMLSDSIRRVAADEAEVLAAIVSRTHTALVDTPTMKSEFRDRPFPAVLDTIKAEYSSHVAANKYYSLGFVISMLQQQVTEIMSGIDLGENQILSIITDRNLLTDLVPKNVNAKHMEGITRFLAAYIVLSQILFLRTLSAAHPELVQISKPINVSRLRRAFRKVLEINYKPIFELDVLEAVPPDYLRDVFDLIWGLEIERVRYELPGRIFHSLMPHEIRKLLAAFYTRPIAAEILANLSIQEAGAEVYDPACGSGTILVSAYRRKKHLFEVQGGIGNPHKRFSEEEIFGSDIMPFAVHLTSANISALAVSEILERTQIVLGDGLTLVPGSEESSGLHNLGQRGLFPTAGRGRRATGEEYQISMRPVDTVLMNPPFTKTERGIAKYVDMRRFQPIVGRNVGLWGHFITLAHEFLTDGGTFGGVIPINILRGSESEQVRDFVLDNWTPLYILKPTVNYAFSEWAEYRDIIIVARKQKAEANHRVKFCLVKSDLTRLTDEDAYELCDQIRSLDSVRSPSLDLDTYPLSVLRDKRSNLMYFCSGSEFKHRDVIVDFLSLFDTVLERPHRSLLKTGIRTTGGTSQLLFFTRHSSPGRCEEAFLRFFGENPDHFIANTEFGTEFRIEREEVLPSLRTPVGLKSMDIGGKWDYIARSEYTELSLVRQASGFLRAIPPAFWLSTERQILAGQSYVSISRRINPSSPNTHHVAFYSDTAISPSDQFNILQTPDPGSAKAVVCLLNSVIFLAQFFLTKEESTGRFVDIRIHDLQGIRFYPSTDAMNKLQEVFEKYRDKPFPPLSGQLDKHFDDRYREYREKRQEKAQARLFSILGKTVESDENRLAFDLDVCKALGVNVTPEQLREIYGALINEMIVTRQLTSD